MKSYVMTWEEAVKVEPELYTFMYREICQDIFVETVNCLNKKLSSQEPQRVVSGFGIAPLTVYSPQENQYPYFIILES